jgi:hypothetical protein
MPHSILSSEFPSENRRFNPSTGSTRYKWATVTRSAPCDNCGRTKKCRRAEGADLILCRDTPHSGDYIDRGPTANGIWNILVPAAAAAEWTAERRAEWAAEQAAARAAERLADQQRMARTMPAGERDRHYRRLFSSLTLNPIDRSDLIRRGLTDPQIEAGGYRSIERGQELGRSYPHSLPGIVNGCWLTMGGGYLAPIRDAEGLIVGAQMRSRSGGYFWLSSANSGGMGPGGIDSEMPLQCHEFKGEPVEAIALAEGTGVKPQLIAARLGVPCIGAAGGNWGSSPIALKAALAASLQPGGTVVLAADGGSRFNPHVMRAYEKTWALISGWGYRFSILWYGQLAKTDGDPDEVEAVKLLTAQNLSWPEFRAIGAPRITARQGDTVVNSGRLSDAIDPRDLFKLGVARVLVSATGSGKTHVTDHAIGHVLAQRPTAIAFQLVHRQLLARANAGGALGRIGHGAFLNDVPEGIGAGMMPGVTLRDSERYTSLCVDSLPRIIERARAAAIAGRKIFIFSDEWESCVSHSLTSSTLGSNGIAVRSALRELLQLAIISGGGIVAADAYLTDEGRSFLETAIGQPVDLIMNTDPGRVSPVTWYEPLRTVDGAPRRVSDQKLGHEAATKISELLRAGERVIVHSDSQSFCERMERVLMTEFPEKRGVRVDRKTSGTLDIQQLLGDLNGEIPLRELDYLIGSPTMAEGVSIDVQRFTQRLLYATHNRVDSQLQSLKRDRNELPTHVFCNRRSFSARIPRTKTEIARTEAFLTAHTVAASGILDVAGPDAVAALNGGGDSWIAACHDARHALIARTEREGIALGENFRARLVADGWPVTVHAYQVTEGADRPLDDAREALRDELSRSMAAAPIDGISVDAARRRLDSSSVGEAEAVWLKKIIQADRFPALGQAKFTADGSIEIDNATPLLLNDAAFQRKNFVTRGAIIPALIRLHHGLNPEIAAVIDRLSIGRSFHSRAIWCPDLSHATADAEIWEAIDRSGILGAQNIAADAPEVARLFAALVDRRALIRAHLGLTVALDEDLNRTPYRQISAVLRAYGVAPVCVGRGSRDEAGNRVRLYSIPSLDEIKSGPAGLVLASLKLRSDRLVREISDGNSLQKVADQLVRIHAGQGFQYGGMDLVAISTSGSRVLATLRGGPADDVFELTNPMGDPSFAWGAKITLKSARQPQPIAA